MPRRRPQGRPTLLTPEIEEKLIHATLIGTPIDLAADYAGVGGSTFRLWMTKGHNETEDRAAGEPPNRTLDPYVTLWGKVVKARAQAAVNGVALINKVARGGNITEETTKKYRDPDTGAVVEESTVKRTAPDWKAAAWMLEKQHRAFFGKEATLEVTGPGGGAMQIETTVVNEDFADRIRENLAFAVQSLNLPELEAGPSEDAVDAEVVEE